MSLVLDASAACEIVLLREHSEQLINLIRKSDWVISPSLYISEINNVFWKYHRFSTLSLTDCESKIEQAISIPDDYIDDSELYREAFSLACLLEHPVYDMLYLVLARRNNATLLTMDKKLNKAAHKANVKTGLITE